MDWSYNRLGIAFKKKIDVGPYKITLNNQYIKIRKNGRKIDYIKDRPISSDLVDLMHELQNNKLDESIYSKLSSDEKELVDLIISDNKHKRYNQSDINQLIEHYNIVKGELLIGNSNPELLHDLKLTIIRLVNLGILTLREITPLLQELFLLIN